MNSSEIKFEVSTVLPGEKKDVTDVKKFHIKTSENLNYAVSVSLISQALKGDVRAIELIFDRMDGKVSQKIETVGDFGSLTTEEKRAKLASLITPANDRD